MTRMHWMLIVGALMRIVGARVDSLSTSAVTYCAPPENVLVQELALTYFRHNASVVFDVTASSLSADLRVALALNLTVYGAQPVSLNLNLCDLASAVCPLPLYNFSGSGTLPIPASFSSKIPSIGYTVPDLEAFAQLELRRVDTGEVAACVSATLTNGWSMRQVGATWGAVGVVLFAIVGSALWALSQARRAGSETGLWAEKEQWRVVDIVTFVQTIAVSALLNLNYPSAFRAFALNFPFALLLNGPLPSQSAIDNLRERTGARLTDDALPPDEYVNRKSSPYNVGLSLGPTSHISQTFDLGNGAGYTLTSLDASGLAAPRGLAKRAFINPATVTSADALAGGVPLYVNGAGVATANAFLGVFFEWLVIGAALLFVCLAYILWRRTSRVQSRTKSRTGMSRTSIMIHGMALRLGLVLVLPVSVFAMHQWTLHDSWLATLLSVLCILTTWAGTLYAFVRLSFHAPTEETGRLASLTPSAPTMALYTVPPFLVALFVAFAGKSGTVQVSALLAIEVLALIAAIVVRWRARRSERDVLLNASSETAPYPTSSPVVPPPTRMSITLRVFRIIGTGLLIAFIQKRGVKPIPRTIIGIVAAAVWSLGVVWAFICVVWGLVKLFRRRRGAAPVLESGEQREKEDVEGKKEGVQDDYVGAAPVLSRPQPQAFQTGSAQTTYYDAHTGNTPAHGVQEQSGEYFGPRYHAQ